MIDRTILVVVSQNQGLYRAYIPDVPGCVASGASEAEALDRLKLTIKEIFEAMQSAGIEFPVQSAVARCLSMDEMMK